MITNDMQHQASAELASLIQKRRNYSTAAVDERGLPQQRCQTYRSSNNPAKRVPRSIIKPVQKRVIPIHGHVVCGAIIEPGERQSTIINSEHKSSCTIVHELPCR